MFARFFLILSLSLSIVQKLPAQNLIRNSSFEEITDLKNDGAFIIAHDWKRYTNLFPENGKYIVNLLLRLKYNGFYDKRTGNEASFLRGLFKNGEHDADYLSQKFNEPLKKNCKYLVKFYVKAPVYSGVYIQEIGAHLSQKPITPKIIKGKGRMLYGIRPQIMADSILDNEKEWTEISGEYIAKGGEQYITIGCFTTYKRTHIELTKVYQSMLSSEKLNGQYYHYPIDDVSIEFIEELEQAEVVANLPAGESIIFENILFNTNSAQLQSSSLPVLDKLVDVLQNNQSIQILIVGHTDNDGDSIKNLQLSSDRASSVVSYLQAKGISNERLKFKGFGDTKPIASNDNSDGKQSNRRVEITVLSK